MERSTLLTFFCQQGRWFRLAVATMLASGATVRGQETPTFSVESQLVVLHVTVKDRAGGYVTDLPKEAFRVLEEDRPQALRFSTDTDTPITLGLLIDNSWSMAPNRRLEHVTPALPPSTPFTSDAALIHAALEASITARGPTALYDAISAAWATFDVALASARCSSS